jgi:leader peptidase (prepilin peptidase)/N-methyltransferase
VIFFILGVIIGSFLNVAIYRLPKGESIIYPPSHCPFCGKRLMIWELIPVISFIALSGRCSRCKQKIPIIYPVVELLTGILFFWVYKSYGNSTEFWGYTIFISILIVSSGIDITVGIIPNYINIIGLFCGIMFGLICGKVNYHLYGAVLGFSIFALIYFFSRGGMGAGDVKFAAVIGSFLGVKLLLVSVFIAFISGAVIGMLLVIINPFWAFHGFRLDCDTAVWKSADNLLYKSFKHLNMGGCVE